MKCDACGNPVATVHLTQVIEGQMQELHLCESCAEQGGVNVQNTVSLPGILMQLGQVKAAPEESHTPEKSCPQCHMRLSDFKKTSRLGCPHCYEAFADELTPLIVPLHKGPTHVGKIPRIGHTSVDVSVLQKKLDAAVATENYEEAAQLRDQIQQMGNSPPPRVKEPTPDAG